MTLVIIYRFLISIMNANLMNEIIVRKQFRSFTFRELVKNTHFFPIKASFHYVFALSYKFNYENTEYGMKFVCHEYPTNIKYIFDTPKDLGIYMFNIIPNIRHECKLCSLGYFDIDPKNLSKSFNGKCLIYNTKEERYDILKSKCKKKFCVSCTKWIENPSLEISKLPKNIENILPYDLWKIIDNNLKSIDFVCKICGDNVCPTTLKKGSSLFAFSLYGEIYPSGKCWSCFKRNL